MLLKGGSLISLYRFLFLLLLGVSAGRAYAQYEEITHFESNITVQSDSILVVEERIRVHVLGSKIKRGIFRDFPTTVRDSWGFRYKVKFDVLEVLRDGVPEHYSIEDITGISLSGSTEGKRVRIGRADVFLPPGDYEYTIKYETFPQIRYFGGYDELYWEVTGHGWEFPIKNVIARVNLPRNIPSSAVKLFGYTGKYGDQGERYKAYRLGADQSIYMFETTEPLGHKEGLTLSVAFPKGFVWEPTSLQKRNWWVESNQGQLYALGGLVLVAFYYLAIWLLVGRDPEGGAIIPRYRPPEGLSAGESRYLWKMGYDKEVFTSEVLYLATKGVLEISQEGDTYTLTKLSSYQGELSTSHKRLLEALFGSAESASLTVKQSNHKTFQKAEKLFKKTLQAKHLTNHFKKNTKFFLVGIFLSVATLWISAWKESYESLGIVIFMSFWLSIWSLGVLAIWSQVFSLWKKALSGEEPFQSVPAFFLTLFGLPFLGGLGLGLFMLYQGTSLLFVLVTALLGVCGYYFHHLLKQPTMRGQKLMDQVDGLRLYLGVAEEDRMRRVSDPELTLELFEKFLPYALALDVDQAWAERFSKILSEAGEGQEARYTPSFYRGSSHSRLSSFSSGFGTSFSSAISGASRSPSSSGSGGGGFSGGGGGGGGGGGW